MGETTERDAPEPARIRTAANGSRSRSKVKAANASTNGQPPVRKAMGPRTALGKERSKLNAVKHGLFSKALMLAGESEAEYSFLLDRLRDDLQPEGELECILVENLAGLLWRKRRFFQAEAAEISDNREFLEIDINAHRYVEAWEHSRGAIVSGGLLKHIGNPLIVREAKETLELLRATVAGGTGFENTRVLKKLYGEDQDKGIPDGIRLFLEVYAESANLPRENGPNRELQELVLKLLDAEIKNLTATQKLGESRDAQRIAYKSTAAMIPGQHVSDRLVRYEAHLSREVDRRLQRIRQRQPLPPRIDLNIT